MVSDQVVIALVTTFGSVISGLLVQVLRQLAKLTTETAAIMTHLGVKIENGVAVPVKSKVLLYEAHNK